jgi:hypothetical protein
MGGIITHRKLAKLRREIENLRAAKHNIKPADLTSMAKRLGRALENRGKHPTWKSELIPSSNPLSIPGHPTIKSTTAMSILDELEADIDRLSELLNDPRGEKNADLDRKQLSPTTIRKNSNP